MVDTTWLQNSAPNVAILIVLWYMDDDAPLLVAILNICIVGHIATSIDFISVETNPIISDTVRCGGIRKSDFTI